MFRRYIDLKVHCYKIIVSLSEYDIIYINKNKHGFI